MKSPIDTTLPVELIWQPDEASCARVEELLHEAIAVARRLGLHVVPDSYGRGVDHRAGRWIALGSVVDPFGALLVHAQPVRRGEGLAATLAAALDVPREWLRALGEALGDAARDDGAPFGALARRLRAACVG
jgi:hypothetical protein